MAKVESGSPRQASVDLRVLRRPWALIAIAAATVLSVLGGTALVGSWRTDSYAVAGDLLVNGSFDVGSAGTGWSTTDPAGLEIWVYSAMVSYTNWTQNQAAYEGPNFAEINASTNGTLFQDVATTPGEVLTWKLAHRARAGNSGTDVMRVLAGPGGGSGATGLVAQSATTKDGVTLGTPKTNLDDTGAAWGVWEGSYTVPAGQTSTRFAFQAISSANGNPSYGNFLDGIQFGNMGKTGVVVTASSPSAILAGAALPALTYSTTPSTTSGDWTTAPSCAVYASSDSSFTTPLSAPLAAGTYVTYCSGGSSTSYFVSSRTTGTLVVNPAYTVTYDGNGSTGGSVPTDSGSYASGGSVTVLGNTGSLVRSGYSFAGWTDNSGGTGTVYASGSSYTVASSNVTFYAKWSPSYSVTYSGNGSTGGSVPVDGSSYASGGSVTVLGNTGSLVRSGYSFAGWTDNSGGTGTVYAPGSSYTVASSNVTLYAKWTALGGSPPGPPQACGGAGCDTPPPGSGSGGDAVPVPVVSPSPSAVVSVPPVVGSLDPVVAASGVPVPPVRLPAGGSQVLSGGVPVGVSVVPDAPRSPTGLEVSGPGFFIKLAGRGDLSDPLGLTEKQVLILQSIQTRRGMLRSREAPRRACGVSDPVAVTSGNGALPGSVVRLYLLPSTYLGEVPVNAAGVFSGSVPVPDGLRPGSYTLQLNSFATTGAVRNVSMGVVVQPALSAQAARTSGEVFFDPLSAQIGAQGLKDLRALAVGSRGRHARVVVTGFVQDTASSANDKSLSLRRAMAVTSLLRKLGVHGSFLIRAGGAAHTGDTARNVQVSITWPRACTT